MIDIDKVIDTESMEKGFMNMVSFCLDDSKMIAGLDECQKAIELCRQFIVCANDMLCRANKTAVELMCQRQLVKSGEEKEALEIYSRVLERLIETYVNGITAAESYMRGVMVVVDAHMQGKGVDKLRQIYKDWEVTFLDDVKNGELGRVLMESQAECGYEFLIDNGVLKHRVFKG